MSQKRSKKGKPPERPTWDLGGELVSYLVTVTMKSGQKYERIRQGTSAYVVIKEVESKLDKWSKKSDVSGFSVDPLPKEPNNIS